jgi:phosphatidylserine/phosphatidylglycerophosphate/cardiolipin synthase-like enzyme
MQGMEALFIATGFTGALTAIWLARIAYKALHPPLSVGVHFSPGGGCTEIVVREIAGAHHEVLVLAYGFTSKPIAQALVDAKLRGVHVEIILDHSNENDPHSLLPFLVEQGLPPLIDPHHAIAHNKVIVVDSKTVLTGSFNFTQQAETHNAENLVLIKSHPELARNYRQDFTNHKGHARPIDNKHNSSTPHGRSHPAHPPAVPHLNSGDILAAIAEGLAANAGHKEKDDSTEKAE